MTHKYDFIVENKAQCESYIQQQTHHDALTTRMAVNAFIKRKAQVHKTATSF